MLFYLIILLGLFLTVVFIVEDSDCAISIAILGLLGIAVSVFILTTISFAFQKEVNRVDCKEDLFSLKMEGAISGRFHIGTGYLNGKQRYYYYLKDSEGFLGLYSAPYYNVKIKEQSGKPYLYYQIIEKRPSSLLVPSFIPSIFEETKIYMYIPEGSVITKFDPN